MCVIFMYIYIYIYYIYIYILILYIYIYIYAHARTHTSISIWTRYNLYYFSCCPKHIQVSYIMCEYEVNMGLKCTLMMFSSQLVERLKNYSSIMYPPPPLLFFKGPSFFILGPFLILFWWHTEPKLCQCPYIPHLVSSLCNMGNMFIQQGRNTLDHFSRLAYKHNLMM